MLHHPLEARERGSGKERPVSAFDETRSVESHEPVPLRPGGYHELEVVERYLPVHLLRLGAGRGVTGAPGVVAQGLCCPPA